MYLLIPAEEKHLDQIVPLLATTGYWEAGVRQNTLDLPSHQFIREYVAKPYLPLTTVVVRSDDKETAIGLLTCGKKQDLDACASIDYRIYLPDIVQQLFINVLTFEITDSYHITFLALNKNCRGQGLGTELMTLAETKWRESQLDTLSLYAFSCQTSALKLYLKAGMMVTNVLKVDERVPCPCVLYFEKNTRTEALQNYFETPAYQSLTF